MFDEAEDSDVTHGGGHVPAILVRPKIHSKYQSTTLYQHESTLRLAMEAVGVIDLPGAPVNAPDRTVTAGLSTSDFLPARTPASVCKG